MPYEVSVTVRVKLDAPSPEQAGAAAVNLLDEALDLVPKPETDRMWEEYGIREVSLGSEYEVRPA